MASSKTKSKSKSKPSKAKASKPAKTAKTAETSAPKGDHARLLAPKTAVSNFITEISAAKNKTSTIGSDVSEATKRAQERGVNVPAARIVERIYKKALLDAAKARVLWEDISYYLLDCMSFDKIAPAGMFDPAETRSTKGSKKNGKKAKPEAEQTDIEEAIEHPEDQPSVEIAGPSPEQDDQPVVH